MMKPELFADALSYTIDRAEVFGKDAPSFNVYVRATLSGREFNLIFQQAQDETSELCGESGDDSEAFYDALTDEITARHPEVKDTEIPPIVRRHLEVMEDEAYQAYLEEKN